MTRSDGETTTTSVELKLEGRQKPISHPPCDAPLCDACQLQDYSFFDLDCMECNNLLKAKDTSIAQIFAIMRQWTPQTQRNMKLLVEEVLTRDSHVNDRDGLTDMSLLHYACKCGAAGIGDAGAACLLVRKLLARGASMSGVCRWSGMSAIHYAAAFDVPQVINVLLRACRGKYVELRCSEYSNGTPLHIAAHHIAIDSARALLHQGADARAKDDQGRTPAECVPDVDTFSCSSNKAQIQKIMERLKALLFTAQTNSQTSPEGNALVQGKATLLALGARLGDRVVVGGVKSGTLRFCGPTEFATGIWAGIELDEPAGKNDGSVSGVAYFSCPPRHGIFAPISKIRPDQTSRRRSSSAKPKRSRSASNSRGKVDVSHVTSKIDTGLRTRTTSQSDADDSVIGTRVVVAGHRKGTIKFYGETDFAPGMWYGIELDSAVGKNDGTVNGHSYFNCPAKHGIFAPPSRVQRLSGSMDSLNTDRSADKQKMKRTYSVELQTVGRSRGSSSDRSSQPLRVSMGKPSRRDPRGMACDLKLEEGMNVFCNNEIAMIRYIGAVDFAEGVWLGLELRAPNGKNDGSVRGKRYFTCRPDHGLIVRPSKVSVRGINGAKLLSDKHRALEK